MTTRPDENLRSKFTNRRIVNCIILYCYYNLLLLCIFFFIKYMPFVVGTLKGDGHMTIMEL